MSSSNFVPIPSLYASLNSVTSLKTSPTIVIALVATAVGLILLTALLTFFILRKKRKKKKLSGNNLEDPVEKTTLVTNNIPQGHASQSVGTPTVNLPVSQGKKGTKPIVKQKTTHSSTSKLSTQRTNLIHQSSSSSSSENSDDNDDRISESDGDSGTLCTDSKPPSTIASCDSNATLSKKEVRFLVPVSNKPHSTSSLPRRLPSQSRSVKDSRVHNSRKVSLARARREKTTQQVSGPVYGNMDPHWGAQRYRQGVPEFMQPQMAREFHPRIAVSNKPWTHQRNLSGSTDISGVTQLSTASAPAFCTQPPHYFGLQQQYPLNYTIQAPPPAKSVYFHSVNSQNLRHPTTLPPSSRMSDLIPLNQLQEYNDYLKHKNKNKKCKSNATLNKVSNKKKSSSKSGSGKTTSKKRKKKGLDKLEAE